MRAGRSLGICLAGLINIFNLPLYVIGGGGEGKAAGVNYEYDPATDKWTKKKSMPRPAHHAALATANGKIYGVSQMNDALTELDPLENASLLAPLLDIPLPNPSSTVRFAK